MQIVKRRQFLSQLAAATALAFVGRSAWARGRKPSAAAGAAPRDSAAADSSARSATPHTGGALIAAAGDTTLGYNLQADFDQRAETGVPKELIDTIYFSGIKPIFDWADLAIVNLECPFTEHGSPLEKNFNFRARTELVELLVQGRVGAVTLANNHLMDYGEIGVSDTIQTLDRAGILHFGAAGNLATAREPLIIERAGVRLGFLGYYFQDAHDMLEPQAVYATDRTAGVAGCYTDLACMTSMLEQDLTALCPRVDAAIPFFHWGHEGSNEVRDYQIALAHRAVDLGARAVLGAHPHRLQGVEVYKDAPIFYSLGNFVFGGNKDPKDKLSAIARLIVPAAGPVTADLVPIQITRWPEAPFQPFPLEEEDKAAALAYLADRSRDFPATLPQLSSAMPLERGVTWPPAPADSAAAGAHHAPADSSGWAPH
jgi:poly-gamma-glutamate synthesis protein (capsule biosynthesis protein)